jgi:hypothetical protein
MAGKLYLLAWVSCSLIFLGSNILRLGFSWWLLAIRIATGGFCPFLILKNPLQEEKEESAANNEDF